MSSTKLAQLHKENCRRVKEENNLWDLESYKVIKNLKDRFAEVVV